MFSAKLDLHLYNYFTLDNSGVLTFFGSFPRVFIIYAEVMWRNELLTTSAIVQWQITSILHTGILTSKQPTSQPLPNKKPGQHL